ncbi:hypothetical protein C1701_08600 [Actinoalloteichus sp. AHMU CJ021]|uniref:DUF4404 family protein n=1 Tax=Actinoalloteichus caeruleus DSM 43889 TaxID=1120930 RepID=A0ABT1JJ19_ACTCY|nr:hypothetical protein [Actinoalloteichus caeruleus]AUS78419.1 hypothetical protein C1701_08600 [Actinoalloteichus sp. AHMU CJ021]MCP2332502.1 hypothetical protein [Actinoalloteichus caeruleus DSM 43889]
MSAIEELRAALLTVVDDVRGASAGLLDVRQRTDRALALLGELSSDHHESLVPPEAQRAAEALEQLSLLVVQVETSVQSVLARL